MKYKKLFKLGMFFCGGCWLFGIGFRMITQFIISPNSFYPTQTLSNFDWWFDWLPMVPIGIFIIYYSLREIVGGLNENINTKT